MNTKSRLPIPILILAVVVVATLIHIEVGANLRQAPEVILVQVRDTKGFADSSAQCFGDVFSSTLNIKKKPLKALVSLYDYLSPRSFFASTEKGFYVLETGLENYQGTFEIRVVCYPKDFSGVSYTIVNNKSQNNCVIENGGKALVC